MFFFGHVGITVGAVRLINRRFGSQADLRKAAFLALCPDLIDKPIAFLYRNVFENHTRLFGHHALASMAVLAYFLGRRRKIRHPWIYGAAFFGHNVLDCFWGKGLPNFVWPLLGKPKPLQPDFFARWYEAFFTPYLMGGEIVGLTILAVLLVKRRREINRGGTEHS